MIGRPPTERSHSCWTQSFRCALAVVMSPVVPTVILSGISRVSDGLDHEACGQDSTNHAGNDHRTIGLARRWGRNRASGNDRRRAQRKQRFPH
jgi:hypothetical protein